VPGGQLRQLAVVVRRKIVADLAELFLDDMEVVDKPLRRRCDGAFILDRAGEGTIGLQEDTPVLANPAGNGMSRAGLGRDWLGCRQRLAVLFQALDAEQLGDDWLVVSPARDAVGDTDRRLRNREEESAAGPGPRSGLRASRLDRDGPMIRRMLLIRVPGCSRDAAVPREGGITPTDPVGYPGDAACALPTPRLLLYQSAALPCDGRGSIEREVTSATWLERAT